MHEVVLVSKCKNLLNSTYVNAIRMCCMCHLGLKKLPEYLVGEVNECYLLHGTKQEHIKNINVEGLDVRVFDSGLFGRGAYFAETSTKSDQHAGMNNFTC